MEQTQQIQLQLIVCPWCFQAVEVTQEEEPMLCPVCNREFTYTDIEYEEQKED